MPYYQFEDDVGQQYGSFEVWQSAEEPVGWYWWSCFPGCLPDGDPNGPFESEKEARDDALSL